ncbi:hypothetical protein J25TS5_10890 [Paenibacillus faecis]|uniref:divergent polysaccharide deacetylase family protein n=1 Tax=Paenibacillus faecis TaxID=862114 RepID=UPI001AFE7584|nr:divergent polysaccharide deacetylase family protein [Paenibacillus faecis]GIO84157.1 hypothetical protein J25TS5_10890 [Paenibacillus faecis]
MRNNKLGKAKRSALLVFLLVAGLGGGPLSGPWVSAGELGAEQVPKGAQKDAQKDAQTEANERPQRLAVIIDDFGNKMGGTEEMLRLPVKLTVAVMPFLPTTREDATRAHEMGHDVLVHLPMEPKRGRPEWLGPGAILSGMSDEEVRLKVEQAIENVPFAKGINNHMGSKITGDQRIMSVILDVCRERGLFFVDSRTNYRSVVTALSQNKGLPNLENDIFLDDVHSTRHISGQLKKAEELLEKKRACIAIGHVGVGGKLTAQTIKQHIPRLQARGVKFIGITELAHEQVSPGSGPGHPFTLP